MKIFRLITVVIIFYSGLLSANTVSISPTFKPVELKEFTSFELPIMPDAGTQLIFPFMLSNPTLKPALKIELTNKKGFSVLSEKDENLVINHNTITITGLAHEKLMPNHLGNLFITVGGYNISISLKTTYDVRKVVSNVVFNIGEEDREHLITHTIDRFKDSLRVEHDKKMKNIGKLARENALSYVGEVALMEPEYTRFKSEVDVEIANSRLVFFADRLVHYDNFSVLVFEIDNPTSIDFSIDNYTMTVLTEDDATQNISGSVKCPKSIAAGEVYKCAYSTIDNKVRGALRYEMSLATDWGTGVAKW